MAAERRVRPQPRPAAPRPGTQEQGKLSVNTAVMHRREERGGSHREETLLERRFAEGEQAAFVRVGVGMTINLGNFESLRLDVAVTLPCLASETEEAYIAASDQVSQYMAEEQSRWTSTSKQKGGR
jgi:hypothetical protein